MTLPERLAQYHAAEGAEEYFDEYTKFHRKLSDRREHKLLDGYFERVGKVTTALDLPCGWGRYMPYLRSHGAEVLEADYSGSMVQKVAEVFPETPLLGRMRCFGHRIPLEDKAVELVFSMRLSHHLPDPVVRREHVEELFRVAERWVIFTYFDRASLKNVIRRARTAIGLSKKHPKNTLSRAQVREIAKNAGFKIHEDPMLFVVGSGHRLVLAERV
ncbi:MAG: class I SAM-dependent methyltransferase [Planctomycetes bacterium]|nr:class I SAM-dependent methyltransferase [Planctomycetota bacterium]MCP4770384.1 class I SAM-dependent methyltransferase [Planctomycetota bacterium]MCP4860524.1 class I SAM-dependent methyltransferase [Planctomycetota bacterium]